MTDAQIARLANALEYYNLGLLTRHDLQNELMCILLEDGFKKSIEEYAKEFKHLIS